MMVNNVSFGANLHVGSGRAVQVEAEEAWKRNKKAGGFLVAV